VIWPGSVVAYMRRTRGVRKSDYVLSSGTLKAMAAKQRG
jgi:hypothetical protein